MNRQVLRNGYVYRQEIEREDDNCKRYHYIDLPEGGSKEIPWSPYSNPSGNDLYAFILLGFPEVEGNLTTKKLEELLNYHAGLQCV